MISIYLCDDQEQQLSLWKKIIEDYLIMHTLDERLDFCTKRPEELLERLSEAPPNMGLYFLDIQLNSDMNGLQLASRIRQIDPFGAIVFITAKSDMSYMTFEYKTEAMDFILKDNVELLPQRIQSCLLKTAQKYHQLKSIPHKVIPFKTRNGQIFVDTDDLLFLETNKSAPHKIFIHTKNGLQNTYGTLKELEASFTERPEFCRCSQSSIVNTNHIQSINKQERILLLSNGSKCPYSAKYLAKIKSIKTNI